MATFVGSHAWNNKKKEEEEGKKKEEEDEGRTRPISLTLHYMEFRKGSEF